MSLSSLHRLAQMIRAGAVIEDKELIEILGPDGTVAVPLQGGGERHLPSGEILSVLAEGADMTVEQVLERSFRLNPEEVATARSFFRFVQFAGEGSKTDSDAAPEQPLQPLDH